VIKVSGSVRGTSSLTTSLQGKPPKPSLQVFLPLRRNNLDKAYADAKGLTNNIKRESTGESAKEKSTPAST
jgi:hypothetical protein